MWPVVDKNDVQQVYDAYAQLTVSSWSGRLYRGTEQIEKRGCVIPEVRGHLRLVLEVGSDIVHVRLQ